MISFENPAELRELFLALLETSNAGMVIIRRDGSVKANQAFYSMLGYSKEDKRDEEWKDLFIRDQINYSDQNSFRSEKQFVKKGGELFWADVNVNLHRDSAGEPLFYVATVIDITDVKRSEELNKHNQELMNYILKNDYSAVCVLDNNLNFIFASDKFIEDFRLPAYNLYGRNMYDAFGTLHDKWKDIHNNALKGAVLRDDYDFFVWPDGTSEVMRWECRPWYNSFEMIGGIIIYTEFITELVNIKDALIEAETRYRQLAFDSKTVGWEVDINGLYTYISDNSEAIIGYKPDELVGRKHVYDLAPVSEREKIKEFAITSIKEGATIESFENPIETKSGKIIYVASNAYPLYGPEGNTIGFRGSDTDISSKRRVEMFRDVLYNITKSSLSSDSIEEYLTGVREELSRVIDTTNFFVALYDKESDMMKKLVYIDEKDYFTEWKAEDSLSGIVIKEGKPKLFLKAESEEYAKRMNFNFGTPAECWLGVPLIVEGERLGVVVVQSYTDPGAYDDASIQLLEMVAHELGLVLHKMSMIEKLIEAKLKAEEGERLKSAFLANMSHEIRTPLNGIMGFVQLLSDDDCEDEERRTYLDLTMESAERLLTTINNIIEVSKIESGLLPVKRECVDIPELMNYLFNFFQLKAFKKRLEFKIDMQLDDTSHIINTDKYLLEGILTNLINNAIKYTERGFVKVGCHYGESGKVVFSVKDSGLGIEKVRQAAIFDRFVQANLEHIRSIEGSGLGLSIVKSYVDKLEGEIWLESEPNVGSSFFFSIPG